MAIEIDFQTNVDETVGQIDRVNEAIGGTAQAAQPASMGLADIKAGLDLAGQAFGMVKGAVESVINPTIEYGKQVRDLGSFAGITAEESSRLIQVADDLGVEFGTLRTAAKAMSENGLQPSVKNLAALADEFSAIQDPVEQSQFLVDKFGARAGPQLAYALRQGSAAILQMGEDAEATGLVVGEDFVDSAREAELALDAWEDAVLSMKVALAEELLPAVTGFVSEAATAVNIHTLLKEATDANALSYEELQRVQQLVYSGDQAAALALLTSATNDLSAANHSTAQHYGQIANSIQPVIDKTRELTAVNSSTGQHYSEFTAGIIANAEEAALAIEASNKRAQESYRELTAIIDGPVGDANDDYYASQKDAGAVIAELMGELDKLKKSHGQVVESTDDGTQAHRNLIIAQADAQLAAENLKKAQEKLAEDPGDLGLQAAVARAETALDTHTAAVAEWEGKVDTANDNYVINNSAAIEAVELKLAEAQAAYDANATAHEEATARIIFNMLQQKLAMDGFTNEEISFLTDVGEAWGIYDTNTANALRAVDTALNTHGLNAQQVVSTLDGMIRNLPDHKTITIETRHVNTYVNPAAGEGTGPGWEPVTTVPDTSSDYQSSVGGAW
jgi:hypothetical protein